MKIIKLTIAVPENKLKTIYHYLGEKGMSLEKELDTCIQKIYEKHVPKDARNLIDNILGKPAVKTKPKQQVRPPGANPPGS